MAEYLARPLICDISSRNDGREQQAENTDGCFKTKVETCRDVTRNLLREEGLEAVMPHYSMYIVGAGQERCLKTRENPKEILEAFNEADNHSKLLIRRRYSNEDIEPYKF